MNHEQPFRIVRSTDLEQCAAAGDDQRRSALWETFVQQAGKRLAGAGTLDFHDLSASASSFLLQPELEAAINEALAVQAPLLLTGEPGTGKTQVAHFLAQYLGAELFQFHVKSTSTANDFKWEFDAVAYLRFGKEAGKEHGKDEGTKAARASGAPDDRSRFRTKKALWLAYECEKRAVVLVDEIDKAPRDFPNDLLHELDQHSFPDPFDTEADGKPKLVRPASNHPPIVVITSNDERRLPDPFLRRCIYHHIRFDDAFVRKIVSARSGKLFPGLEGDVLKRAIDLFLDLRRKTGFTRKPATAELLTWLAILAARKTAAGELTSLHQELPGLAAIVKDSRDLEKLPKSA